MWEGFRCFFQWLVFSPLDFRVKGLVLLLQTGLRFKGFRFGLLDSGGLVF